VTEVRYVETPEEAYTEGPLTVQDLLDSITIYLADGGAATDLVGVSMTGDPNSEPPIGFVYEKDTNTGGRKFLVEMRGPTELEQALITDVLRGTLEIFRVDI
jgi:hypothetical protein